MQKSSCVYGKKNIGVKLKITVLRVRNAEAAGSNPAQSIISFEPPKGVDISIDFWLKFGRDLYGRTD